MPLSATAPKSCPRANLRHAQKAVGLLGNASQTTCSWKMTQKTRRSNYYWDQQNFAAAIGINTTAIRNVRVVDAGVLHVRPAGFMRQHKLDGFKQISDQAANEPGDIN